MSSSCRGLAYPSPHAPVPDPCQLRPKHRRLRPDRRGIGPHVGVPSFAVPHRSPGSSIAHVGTGQRIADA
eukprot:1899111-Rhodomonas_salina.3